MKQNKESFKNLNEKANILVKNIDKDVKQGDLFSLFSEFGAIQSCKLESYPDGSSRGFAYIQFEKEEDATNAKTKMNGHEINGKKLEVNIFEKKDKR